MGKGWENQSPRVVFWKDCAFPLMTLRFERYFPVCNCCFLLFVVKAGPYKIKSGAGPDTLPTANNINEYGRRGIATDIKPRNWILYMTISFWSRKPVFQVHNNRMSAPPAVPSQRKVTGSYISIFYILVPIEK